MFISNFYRKLYLLDDDNNYNDRDEYISNAELIKKILHICAIYPQVVTILGLFFTRHILEFMNMPRTLFYDGLNILVPILIIPGIFKGGYIIDTIMSIIFAFYLIRDNIQFISEPSMLLFFSIIAEMFVLVHTRYNFGCRLFNER